MSKFPWTQAVIVTEECREKKDKESKPKKQDKEITGLRYVPWLFKDTKKD